MAREINRLNVQFVKNVTEPGRHADGGGLYLNTTNGGRRWIFLFRWNGKHGEMGLGSARDVSLAKARELARQAREHVATGVNPIAARKGTDQVTFGDCADALIKNMLPSWRNPKHASQWKMTLLVYAKPLRPMGVGTVETKDVLAVLEPIWTTKSETASRVRGRIERVLDFAKAQGHRSGENPARWRGHLDQVLPPRGKLTRGHHAALPYDQIAGFMTDIAGRTASAARALEFTILTAGRTSEVLSARWTEMDLEKAIWTVPGSRMKAGKEHRVPLSPAVMDVLATQKTTGGSEFVFPGTTDRTKPLSTMAMEMLLRRTGVEVTVHGFRSTFRDWAAETTGFPHEVCEMALAHTIANKAEAAYRRGDLFEKRRDLMNAWAAYCTPPAKGPEA